MNDFLCFFSVGKQLQAGDAARIHDYTVQLEYQKRQEPRLVDVVPYPRPRFYAEVLRPLANFDMGTALSIWQGVQALCLVGIWILMLRQFPADPVLLAVFFFPLPIGLRMGRMWALWGWGRPGACTCISVGSP